MIKQKAPKDMTVDEFIDLVERRYGTKEPTNMSVWINTLRMIADEPAPNPFTPDQIAWMRETQRSGSFYAAMDRDGSVCLYEKKPEKHCTEWLSCGEKNGSTAAINGGFTFLSKHLSWDDPEPLCFADYAPITGDVGFIETKEPEQRNSDYEDRLCPPFSNN